MALGQFPEQPQYRAVSVRIKRSYHWAAKTSVPVFKYVVVLSTSNEMHLTQKKMHFISNLTLVNQTYLGISQNEIFLKEL